MPAPSSLVIFDCDGVLIDSEILACGAVASSLKELGIEISTTEIACRYAGFTADAMYKDVEARYGRSIPIDFRNVVQRRVLDEFERDLHPMPGVEEILQALPCRFCVASSSSLERIEFSLRRTGLFHFFENKIFSAMQVAVGKPAPDLFEFAAKSMLADNRKCIVIEDSVSGILAANAARMYAVGFVGGSHGSDELAQRLSAASAKVVIDRMDKLLKIIDAFLAPK
jgi:HAD superfamily hydrolase (TIGR01509 family)